MIFFYSNLSFPARRHLIPI